MATVSTIDAGELEQYRRELTGYCYRMLGSAFEAEDAVQETMLRAWRSLDRFEGRASLKSWLYRIATNVCFDQLNGRERRARPIDLGPAQGPVIEDPAQPPRSTRPTELLHEDAIQSMPPFSLWLRGRDDIFTWWLGPGIGCKGSKLLPVGDVNGSPAWAQYKPAPDGGYEPWSIMVVEVSGGRIGEL